jgi:hypothetical protein
MEGMIISKIAARYLFASSDEDSLVYVLSSLLVLAEIRYQF